MDLQRAGRNPNAGLGDRVQAFYFKAYFQMPKAFCTASQQDPSEKGVWLQASSPDIQ